VLRRRQTLLWWQVLTIRSHRSPGGGHEARRVPVSIFALSPLHVTSCRWSVGDTLRVALAWSRVGTLADSVHCQLTVRIVSPLFALTPFVAG
jgi:hypothetical protein